MQTRSASTVPRSVDEESRTVEVVWSTGAEVQRYDWMGGTRYVEKLSMEPKAVDLRRMKAGAPLLNAHSSYEVGDILGVIESAEIRDGQGLATVRFSSRPDAEGAWTDVKTGITRNISVGYRIHETKVSKRADGVEIRLATRWEPMEISLVPIGADAGAQVRAGIDMNNCDIIEEHEMPEETRAADDAATGAEAEVKRAAELAKADLKRMREAEAERVREIHDLGKRGGATGDDIATAIESGVSGGDFAKSLVGKRAAADDDIKTRAPGRVTEDVTDKFREGVEKSILFKAGITGGERNEFSSMRLDAVARECLRIRNIPDQANDIRELIGRAFVTRVEPTHSSSDFAHILGNVANKSMMMGLEESDETFQLWTKPGTLTDFKVVDRVGLTTFPSLRQVLPGAAYKSITIGNYKEQLQLATYGELFSINRESIINDDLSAFTETPRLMGRAAIRTVGDLVYAILTDNPTMGDGNALWDATNHNNYTASGTAVSVASLSVARTTMATQKDRSNNAHSLGIQMAYLLVPEAISDNARVHQSSEWDPTATQKVPNPHRGRFEVIADSRLDDDDTNAWYAVANPMKHPTVEVGYLNGVRTPTLEQQDGWTIDGVEFKVRMDATAKALAWEAMYFNEGA